MPIAPGEAGSASELRLEAPTSPDPNKLREIPPLTGLRFIAAFSILFSHTIMWTCPFNDTLIFVPIRESVSLIGMPLFFVLSGFVIHYNYGHGFHTLPYGVSLRNFFSARFARIYPLFLFFAVFGIISDFMVNWIADYRSDLLSFVVHSITLTQSWVYQIVVNDRLLLDNGFGLSWSISDEFFFYISYTLFVFLILPLRKSATTLVVIAIFSSLVIGFLLFIRAHFDVLIGFAQQHIDNFQPNEGNPDNSFSRWLFYYSPYARIWEFIIGCLAAQLFLILRRRDVTRGESRWGAVALWSALIFLIAYDASNLVALQSGRHKLITFLGSNFGCALPLAAIVFCTARYGSVVARLLSHPWMIWLGEISYSIYAVHTWTIRPFVRPAANFSIALGLDAVLRIGFALAFTVIVASATYRLIEVPCRRYLRRKLMRPASPASAPAATVQTTA
jgi:peptidoglycan/LPS O-acetylase OafA/YrhL